MTNFGWYRTGPKLPPPATGIKIAKSPPQWWAQQWIEALVSVLRGDQTRLTRGLTYARAGRTHDLVIAGGVVTAKVTGSQTRPYLVKITVAQIPDEVWTRVISTMAQSAQFAAELLAGTMPVKIGEVFREAGAGLFPTTRGDLVTSCSCRDWAQPCKHVASTHYVLGDALDRDPFLLFELRGRTKAQVLDALRAARVAESSNNDTPAAAIETHAQTREVATVTLGKLSVEEYEQAVGPLPNLHLSFDTFGGPLATEAVLRQLGIPVGWSGDKSPVDLLAPLVHAAAARARQIAMAETIQPSGDGLIDKFAPTRRPASKPR